jgi:hypothetical protein
MERDALPVMLVTALQAGYGSGQRCAVCDYFIAQSQVEYEVAIPQSGTVALHLTCFALWQLECADRLRHVNRRAGYESQGAVGGEGGTSGTGAPDGN